MWGGGDRNYRINGCRGNVWWWSWNYRVRWSQVRQGGVLLRGRGGGGERERETQVFNGTIV